MSSLCIVIVNWNSGGLLEACVRSVVAAEPGGLPARHVVVVDNASTDGSADFLDGTPLPSARLLRNAENAGFGRACNMGVDLHRSERGDPDFILFLNPDTVVRPDTFARLFAHDALRDPATGIWGVRMTDDSGTAVTCSNFPSVLNFTCKATGLDRLLPAAMWAQHHMRYFDHAADRVVDQVMGAFLLIRGGLFAELGGFDERFFVYFEEVDLCRRARLAGRRTRFLAGPEIRHVGCGTTAAVKDLRLRLSLSSRLKYFRKHHSPVAWLYLGLLSLTIEPLARLVHLTLTGRAAEIPGLISAYAAFARRGGTS